MFIHLYVVCKLKQNENLFVANWMLINTATASILRFIFFNNMSVY